jgi:hypothetical protein
MIGGTVFVVASLALTSCTAPGGTTVAQTTKVNYYPQCYQPVAQLHQQDEQFAQTMAVNTAIGAAGGALAGGLISGNYKGALVGALAGGFAAAASTYVQNLSQQYPDPEARRGKIADDMGRDRGTMQRAVVAARQSRSCYNVQFDQVVASVRRGAMPKDEARLRFAEIEQGEHETAAILAEYGKKANDNVQIYKTAVEQEAKAENVPADEVTGSAATTTTTRAPSKTRKSANTQKMADNYKGVNQQASEINQEAASEQQTADAHKKTAQDLTAT